MTREELIEFLSKNLTIEVSHPKHGVERCGYYYTEPDKHNITVAVKLCGELICKDTSYSL